MCLEEAESRSGNPASADGSSTQRRDRTSDTPPMFRWGNSCVIPQPRPSVYMCGGDSEILEVIQQIASADARNTSARAATRSFGGNSASAHVLLFPFTVATRKMFFHAFITAQFCLTVARHYPFLTHLLHF